MLLYLEHMIALNFTVVTPGESQGHNYFLHFLLFPETTKREEVLQLLNARTCCSESILK